MLTLDGIIFSLQKAGGISNYYSRILEGIIEADLKFDYYEHQNENLFRKELSDECLNPQSESSLPVNLLRYLDFRKSGKAETVFHSSYYRTSKNPGAVNITTVHDFTYEKFRNGPAKMVHSWQKFKAVRNSSVVITVSESTAKDLKVYCPDFPANKIVVIANGVSEAFRPLTHVRPQDQKSDIVYIGSRSGYKNFDFVCEVVSELKHHRLIIIGGGPLTRAEIRIMNGFKERTVFLESVSEQELNKIYNSSLCLFYPSSYEGFGIPVLEAMKAGCPVLAFNRSAIPEVAGDAAFLLDQLNVQAAVQCIKSFEDPAVRRDCIAKGLIQAEKFSWKKTVEQTISVYKEKGA